MARQDSHGLHHLEKRKRVHQKLEKFPHPNKWIRLMDKIVYVAVFVGPLITILQVIKIFSEKTAAGVSIITWSTYLLSSTIWLIYSKMHKDIPLLFSSILWVILIILVIIGTAIYG